MLEVYDNAQVLSLLKKYPSGNAKNYKGQIKKEY